MRESMEESTRGTIGNGVWCMYSTPSLSSPSQAQEVNPSAFLPKLTATAAVNTYVGGGFWPSPQLMQSLLMPHRALGRDMDVHLPSTAYFIHVGLGSGI